MRNCIFTPFFLLHFLFGSQRLNRTQMQSINSKKYNSFEDGLRQTIFEYANTLQINLNNLINKTYISIIVRIIAQDLLNHPHIAKKLFLNKNKSIIAAIKAQTINIVCSKCNIYDHDYIIKLGHSIIDQIIKELKHKIDL